MSDKTGIEWTDATWNPIRGCTRVSEGCRNCYAEMMAARFSKPGQWGHGLAEMRHGKAHWTGKIEFVEKHLLDPLKWKMVPSDDRDPLTGLPARRRRIFVNSVSDLFHEGVIDEMLDQIFAVMALCPQHTFQVLTKRPERMREYMAQVSAESDRQRWAQYVPGLCDALPGKRGSAEVVGALVDSWEWPPRNVWLGVSVENQETADKRIPELLKTPAAVRFLSCEPLLGPITFRPRCDSLEDKLHAMEYGYASKPMELVGIDWVICGGESGPHARPMHPDWARGLRDQCQAAGVPFFFKQWGEWAQSTEPVESFSKSSGDFETIPAHLAFKKVGKHAAGAILDGMEWKQFPETRR